VNPLKTSNHSQNIHTDHFRVNDISISDYGTYGVSMAQGSMSKTILIVSIISAILISSSVSVAALGLTDQQGTQEPIGTQQPVKDDEATGATNATGKTGPTGNATRYVIEGWFNTSLPGDLVYEGMNWKRINVPQLDLADMPSVQLFVKSNNPANVTIDGQPATINMWENYHAVIGNPDGILFDNGCVYICYEGNGYSPISGDYKIVVVK
jgi:hypothetical protein